MDSSFRLPVSLVAPKSFVVAKFSLPGHFITLVIVSYFLSNFTEKYSAPAWGKGGNEEKCVLLLPKEERNHLKFYLDTASPTQE